MSSLLDRLYDGIVRTRGRGVANATALVTIGSSGAVAGATGDTNIVTITKESGAGTYTATFVGAVSAIRSVDVIPVLQSTKTVTVFVSAISLTTASVTFCFVDKADTLTNLASGDKFILSVEFSSQLGTA